MRFDVQVDAGDVVEQLAGLDGQMRFAMSKALNATANDAQRAIQDSLASRFTLRRPEFIKRTIKRNKGDFATKEMLVASVRIDPTRDLLAKFEDGGMKVPTNGRAIAIPTEHVRRTKAQIVQASQRPRPLIASGKGFSKSGRLLMRIGRGARAMLRTAYVFKARVRIPKRLGFVDTATTSVDRTWEARTRAAIDSVLASLRL